MLRARNDPGARGGRQPERVAAETYRASIDRTYRLDQIADAYRYVANGQKAGIVVILVAEGQGESV